MLLATIALGCITREPTQYRGEMVTLIDIREEWRLITGEYIKQFVFVYRTPEFRILELSYPLNKSLEIGSQHLMPLQR